MGNNIPQQKPLFEGMAQKPAATYDSIVKSQAYLHAISGASQIENPWAKKAFTFLVTYSAANPSFTNEDLRIASAGKVPETGDARAWGPVLRMAQKRGVIKKEGFKKGIMAQCHRGTKTLWEAQFAAATKKQGEKNNLPKKRFTLSEMAQCFDDAVEFVQKIKDAKKIKEEKEKYFQEKFNVKLK